MDTENLQGVLVEQDLQHTDRIAGDLGTGGILEKRLADFVRHFRFGQLALIGAKGADFRNGIDTGRHVADETVLLLQQLVARVEPLIVGGTGQAWPTNDVARRINMRNRGAVVLIHAELAPAIRFQADILQPQAVGVTSTAVGP